jgi:4-aminobutyrate aminotransferase
MKQGVEQMAARFPVIGDVRGSGFMIGVEFIDPKTKAPAEKLCDDLVQKAFRKGLLLLGAGKSTIRLAPPLVLTKDEITTGLAIMEECLKELT